MYHLFNQSATLKRYDRVTGTNKLRYNTGTTIYCHFQPMDSGYSNTTDGGLSQAHRMWCDSTTDIREGDLITIDSKDYKVRGVKDYTISNYKHKRVILEKVLC